MNLTALFVIQAAMLSTGQTYAEAHREMKTTGRPMIVLVSAPWCPACQSMKNTVVPKLRQRGSLDQVAFTVVDVDAQPKLARRLMSGGTIPQLIMYYQAPDGWQRRQMTGGTSVAAVETMIVAGLRSAGAKVARGKEGPLPEPTPSPSGK